MPLPIEWQIGRSVPIPGVGGRVRAELDFLPARVNRMFLRHIVEYEPSATEQQTWATQAGRSSASTGGPAATYQLEWFRPGDRRARLNRGDVLIFVTDDNEWIYPPAGTRRPIRPGPATNSSVALLDQAPSGGGSVQHVVSPAPLGRTLRTGRPSGARPPCGSSTAQDRSTRRILACSGRQ
nr:hypothetical protein JVH1_4108 [Rhodococcus sp. JVH1]